VAYVVFFEQFLSGIQKHFGVNTTINTKINHNNCNKMVAQVSVKSTKLSVPLMCKVKVSPLVTVYLISYVIPKLFTSQLAVNLNF
jgi:hypothetical protein